MGLSDEWDMRPRIRLRVLDDSVVEAVGGEALVVVVVV